MQTLILVDLDRLYPNPYQLQVRTGGIDRAHAARLALSMRANIDARPDMRGLYQALLARPFPDYPNAYQLADGHHRLEAARLLRDGGVVEVDGEPVAFDADPRWGRAPVIVEAISDRDMLLAAVDTALNHKSLGPIDRASAFQALVDGGMAVGEVARRYHLAPSTVSNLVRLLALPEGVRDLVNAGVLPERAGRELLVLARFEGALEGYAHADGLGLWTDTNRFARGVSAETLPGRDDLYLVAADAIADRVDLALQAYAVRLRDYTTAWPLAEWSPRGDPLLSVNDVDRLFGHALPAGACAGCEHVFRRKATDWCSKRDCHEARRGLWDLRTARLMEKTAQARQRAAPGNGGTAPAPPEGAPAAQPSPARDSISLFTERDRAEGEALRKRRQALVALAGQVTGDTAGRAALSENVLLLQELADALNRPRGFGEPTRAAAPGALWQEIIGGLARRIESQYQIGVRARLDILTQLIEALGGAADPVDLRALERVDALFLVDKAASLPGKPLGFDLERLERLAATGAAHLDGPQRAETLAALEAWAQQPAAGDAGDARARLAAVIALVRGEPLAVSPPLATSSSPAMSSSLATSSSPISAEMVEAAGATP